MKATYQKERPFTHGVTIRDAILVDSPQMVAEHPWEALPPQVADVLRPELPTLADEIVAELSRGVPDYARPLEGPFGQALRAGVEEALGRFTSFVENPGADPDAGREVYLDLGRGEKRAGLSPRTLYTLAEAIFAYIDELSADSIEGYAREQAAAAGALQRRRQRLAALLVQDPPAAPATVEAAASNAGWRLPRSLSVLVVESGESSEGTERLAVRLGPEALVTHQPPLNVALIPAPVRREELEAAVRDRRAALGPEVAWQEAALSFERAREVLRLAGEGGIDGNEPLLVAERHRLSLLLGADRRLARDVAESALAPLEGETELSRERLGSTLDAWLRHRGRTEAVAKALHVHPQTVRYRLARLRELFGNRLDDPDGRFELELALRARRIAG